MITVSTYPGVPYFVKLIDVVASTDPERIHQGYARNHNQDQGAGGIAWT